MALDPLQAGTETPGKGQSGHQGTVTGPPVANSSPKTTITGFLRRKKRNVVATVYVRLDAADAKMTKRLMQAFGRDASQLFRDMVREKYAQLYESIIEPHEAKIDEP